MEFHFLGTSAGSPTLERNVTALGLVVQQRKDWYLFDCGEGTQQRLLRSTLSPVRLSRIFITHLHGDHCYGLPGLISSRGLLGATEPLEIYGPKGLKEMIEVTFRCSYMRPSFPCTVTEFSQGGEVLLDDENERVEVVRLSHDVPSYAFVLTEKDRRGVFQVDKAREAGIAPGPLFGRLKKGETVTLEDGRSFNGADFVGESQKGRKIIVSGDNDKPSLLAEHLKDAELFIHESTHTEEAAAKLSFKSRHSTAKVVCEEATKADLPNLILTHFSPRFSLRAQGDGSMSKVKDEAEEFYKGNLNFAQDFDVYNLNRAGEVSLVDRRSKFLYI
mgnify:CR=1 FL=1